MPEGAVITEGKLELGDPHFRFRRYIIIVIITALLESVFSHSRSHLLFHKRDTKHNVAQ